MIKEIISKLLLVTLIVFGTNLLKAQEDDSIIPTSFINIEIDDNKLIEQLKISLKTDSTNLRHIMLLGSIWESHLQYDSAAIAYSKAITVDSTCIKCHQKLAGVMAGKGMIKKSIELYNKTLSLDSTNTTARTQLARLLKRESRFKEAFDQFSFLLISDSTNFFLWEQVGDCAMRIDSASIGMLAYMYSFEINPANMPLAIKLINGFIQSGTPPIWIFPFTKRAYQEDSAYVPLIRVKGYLHFLNKDYRQAESWLNKAFVLGDSTRFNLKFLGITHYHIGNFTKSNDFLEKAYAIDSTDKVMNFVYAKALNQIGGRKKAIEILNLTERLMTPCPEEMGLIYVTRADAYQRDRQYALSIGQYEKALEFTPNETDYYYQIAMNYYYAKEYLSARNAFNKYLSIIKSNEEVYSRKAGYINHLLQRIEKELFFLDKQ